MSSGAQTILAGNFNVQFSSLCEWICFELELNFRLYVSHKPTKFGSGDELFGRNRDDSHSYQQPQVLSARSIESLALLENERKQNVPTLI